VAALEPGRSSWTRLLDAVRLGPADDLAAVTAAQVRDVVQQLIAGGHWRDGDPAILVIFDAGYEPARLAWLLGDLPVQVIGRLGTSRVLRQPPPPREPGQMGRPARHGRELKLAGEAVHPGPDVTTTTVTTRYGTATARARARGAPQAQGPRRLGRPPGRASRHRGHLDPAHRRSPAARPPPQARVAVDLPP
jgi:hypothetical protein